MLLEPINQSLGGDWRLGRPWMETLQALEASTLLREEGGRPWRLRQGLVEALQALKASTMSGEEGGWPWRPWEGARQASGCDGLEEREKKNEEEEKKRRLGFCMLRYHVEK